MIITALIFILFTCMIGIISYHYIKKSWYIVKSIKYMRLQKMLMELQMKKQMKETQTKKPTSDRDDPMFG